MKNKYPYNFRTRIFLLFYKFVWVLFFPLVVLYFLKRSMKESNYRLNFLERLGFSKGFAPNSVWIHAVSLGEFRASVPLIKKLLQRSEKIILTTITPAGREEAQRILKFDISIGNVFVVYLPLEYSFAFKNFLNRCKPRLAIVLEYELWPVMISACSRYSVPLILAQGQYVEKSFLIDQKWPFFRGALFNGFDLILAKSQLHSTRYKFFCNSSVPVTVMGELRFDQIIPQEQLKKANLFLRKTSLKKDFRLCFCFGSTGPREDTILISLMQRLTAEAKKLGKPKPFYVYVPRHKKDFLEIEKDLSRSGLKFVKRTNVFEKNLELKDKSGLIISESDGIFGDSLGEINFYFQISDHVFIGNSFNKLGSHNIIEPLALKKPVAVGPSIWGIEYPIVEALEVGIIKKVQNSEELFQYWWSQMVTTENAGEHKALMQSFYNIHSGAVKRCIEKLEEYKFLLK